MNRLLILIVSLMFIPFGWSQQSLSLTEAIMEGLQNNRIMVNVGYDIQIARERQWETIATGLPQISASAFYNKDLEQRTSIVPGAYFGGNPGEYYPVQFGTEQSVDAAARLDQLIFDGSYLVGLQASSVFLKISRQNKVKSELEVKRLVTDAYVNVLLAEERKRILEKNLANLEGTLTDVRKVYQQGLVEVEQVEQLEITSASIQSALDYVLRLVPITHQILNMALGRDLNDNVALTDTLLGLCVKSENELISSDWDLEKNIDYQIAQNNLRSSKLLLKLERFRALPTISAFIISGYDGYNDDFTFFQKSQQWYDRSAIGLSVTLSIFTSGAGQSRTDQAKLNVAKAQAQLEQVEEELLLQKANAHNQFTLALEAFLRSQKSLEIAYRIERKNNLKYSEGVSGSFELRQAQLQLYDLQNQHLNTMRDIIQSKTELDILYHSSPEIVKK
ncbi:MAG: TolC family protein [Flavobacteriaceae bacterium]